MKAAKTSLLKPYKKDNAGKLVPALEIVKQNPHSAGVYLIFSERTGKPVYIGYSERNLYKTIYRHFQSWNDSQTNRKVYNKTGYKVRVIFTTPGRAFLLEKYLIMKIKPRDNKEKYENYLFPKQKADAKAIEADTILLSVNDDCPF